MLALSSQQGQVSQFEVHLVSVTATLARSPCFLAHIFHFALLASDSKAVSQAPKRSDSMFRLPVLHARAHICVCVRTWMLKYTWMLKDHCRLLQVRVARTAGNQAFREGMQAYTGVCACMRACTYACICACVREPGMKMA